MLCALLLAQMLLCIVYGIDVIMPISCNVLLAQMLLCIIYGQDVIEPFFFVLLSHYFIFSSGMLNNMLSQMCGRLYFPIFLLSVGLFTLMYIDSLTVLVLIYSYTCGSIDCGEEYIGESGRTFGERYKEHLKAPSPFSNIRTIVAMKHL